MDNTIDAIGLVSSILIAVMFVPQVVHVHRTKDTYSFLFLNMLASSMGLIYSIHFRVVPMIVANTSAGLFSVSLAGMKYVNEVKEKIPDIDIVSDTPALMV